MGAGTGQDKSQGPGSCHGGVQAGLEAHLALALASRVTVAAATAPGVTATLDGLWQLPRIS